MCHFCCWPYWLLVWNFWCSIAFPAWISCAKDSNAGASTPSTPLRDVPNVCSIESLSDCHVIFYCNCTGKNNTKKSKQIEQWIYHAAATLLTNMLQKWYGGSKISVTTGQLRFNLSCWMAESWTILACTLAEARISFLSLLLEIDTVRFGNLVNRIVRASPRLRQIESHLADQLWLCSPPAQDPSGSHFETFCLLFPPNPESYWISGISCFNTSWQQWLFAFTNFVSCTHCKGCTMMQTRGQGRWWKLGIEFESVIRANVDGLRGDSNSRIFCLRICCFSSSEEVSRWGEGSPGKYGWTCKQALCWGKEALPNYQVLMCRCNVRLKFNDQGETRPWPFDYTTLPGSFLKRSVCFFHDCAWLKFLRSWAEACS